MMSTTELPITYGITEDVNSTVTQESRNFLDLRFYALAVVIPIGLIFNLLSCAVFLQPKLRKSVTGHYFFALACADNVVLLSDLFRWLNAFERRGFFTGLNFMHKIDGVCKFVHAIRYFGWFISSWLIVTISIERFIAVSYPLMYKRLSTPKRAQLIIIGLTMVSFILACPGIFTVGVTSVERLCAVHNEYVHIYWVWFLSVVTPIGLAIPCALVVVFTSLIIYKLIKARQAQVDTLEGQEKQSEMSKRPTAALLAVAIAFITLQTPFILMFLLNVVFKSWRLQLRMLFHFTYILNVINYSINFFLYIVTGKTFRQELRTLFLCKCIRECSLWKKGQASTPQPLHQTQYYNKAFMMDA